MRAGSPPRSVLPRRDSNLEAVRGADVVVLAVPFVGTLEQVAGEIREAVAGKTVIDVTNPLRTDYSGLAVEGSSGAEELQRWLPEAAVVEGLQHGLRLEPGRPGGGHAGLRGGGRRCGRAAGDGPGCLDGLQSAARRQARAGPGPEAMAFLNISLNAANGWSWSSAWKLEP